MRVTKVLFIFTTTPSNYPLHRGRADYQAVSPLSKGELVGVVV